MVTKLKGPRGQKISARVRRKSPPPKSKMPPRTRMLQLRQKKQRLGLSKLIIRLRMLLPLGQASKKILLLPWRRLRT